MQAKKGTTLDEVGGEQGGRLVVALERAERQVGLDLHGEEVARELLLELRRIGRVELDAEAQHRRRVGQRQAQLPVQRLLHVQPEALRLKNDSRLVLAMLHRRRYRDH